MKIWMSSSVGSTLNHAAGIPARVRSCCHWASSAVLPKPGPACTRNMREPAGTPSRDSRRARCTQRALGRGAESFVARKTESGSPEATGAELALRVIWNPLRRLLERSLARDATRAAKPCQAKDGPITTTRTFAASNPCIAAHRRRDTDSAKTAPDTQRGPVPCPASRAACARK